MYTNIQRHDITQEEYFALPGISNSDVSLFYRSPSRYKAKLDGLPEERTTKPMLMGSAFDTLLLEPHLFERNYFVMPAGIISPSSAMQERLVDAMMLDYGMGEAFDYAGYKNPNPKTWNDLKPWVDMRLSAGRRATISNEDYHNLKRMLDSVRDNPAASQAVSESEAQVVFTATHEETGLEVKGMLDLLGPDYVADIKTTGEEVYRFPAKLFRYDYDRQMGHYTALAGLDCGRFIAVEREHLNECDCIELSWERLDAGRRKMDRALKDIKASSADNYTHRAHHYTNGGWRVLL